MAQGWFLRILFGQSQLLVRKWTTQSSHALKEIGTKSKCRFIPLSSCTAVYHYTVFFADILNMDYDIQMKFSAQIKYPAARKKMTTVHKNSTLLKNTWLWSFLIFGFIAAVYELIKGSNTHWPCIMFLMPFRDSEHLYLWRGTMAASQWGEGGGTRHSSRFLLLLIRFWEWQGFFVVKYLYFVPHALSKPFKKIFHPRFTQYFPGSMWMAWEECPPQCRELAKETTEEEVSKM